MINNQIYDEIGEDWYTAYDNPVALLRQESKTKIPWVLEKSRAHFGNLENLRMLDVGCGGGFLSNRLAESGLNVDAIDLSEESLKVARRHDSTGRVNYQKADAFHLPFKDREFEIVTAMDFLEHIDDPARSIREISRVLKPGGIFFFHTFNRNFLAQLVVIKAVEWFVKNTPKNMHVIELFIKPEELRQMCAASGLETRAMIGLRPLFRTLTWRGLITRTVPKDFAFRLTNSLTLSYMGYAIASKQ